MEEVSPPKTNVYISAIQADMLSAGPGNRTEIFFYGCERACPGCVNKWTLEQPYRVTTIDDTMEEVKRIGNFKVSIGGGEPFQQPEALYELVAKLWEWSMLNLQEPDILVYTGRNLAEIIDSPVLDYVTWLVTEPYDENSKCIKIETSFIGSHNQFLLRCKYPRRVVLRGWENIQYSKYGDITNDDKNSNNSSTCAQTSVDDFYEIEAIIKENTIEHNWRPWKWKE